MIRTLTKFLPRAASLAGPSQAPQLFVAAQSALITTRASSWRETRSAGVEPARAPSYSQFLGNMHPSNSFPEALGRGHGEFFPMLGSAMHAEHLAFELAKMNTFLQLHFPGSQHQVPFAPVDSSSLDSAGLYCDSVKRKRRKKMKKHKHKKLMKRLQGRG